MHVPATLFALVASLIAAFWCWLGAPVPMPPSPLAAGEKLYCVSYAPFRGTQSPLTDATRVSAQQIDQDMARLAQVTGCVRTYSIQHGLEQIPAIAGKHGLQVMQGIWLSSDREKNRREIEGTVALVNQHPSVVRSVIVGNEVLLRGEMTGADLANAVREVKTRVRVPVTYADVWEFWLRHLDLANAVDFITIHILPYWEDHPIAARHGASHVDSIRARVAAIFPGREILIGETGWPSAGRMREGAQPSRSSQARLIHEVLNTAKAGNYRVNVIEAFDQPWKRALEGTVGGHWGLYDDVSRSPKFGWGEPISDHPYWKLQAVGGIAFAAVIFGCAWFARGAFADSALRNWTGVATIALAGGALIGWTAENFVLQSLGIGGAIRSLALGLVVLAAPLLGAAAWMRGITPPSFAQLLGGEAPRVEGWLALAFGLTLTLLCAVALEVALGLMFDPRYRDFPFAPLTAAVTPFVLIALARPVGERKGLAEIVTAGTLTIAVIYFTFNEGFANWQSLWLAAALIMLIAALIRPRLRRSADVRG
jgi:exo-beta-1,3-glucanase (GH17 family)